MDYSYRHRNSYSPRAPPPPITSSMYPKMGSQPIQTDHAPPLPVRGSFAPQHNPPPPSSSTTGMGIRVSIKPEYRITSPPELFPQAKEVPQSKFHFDFEFERKFLAEIEKNGFCNWSKFSSEYQPLKDHTSSNSSMGAVNDVVVDKYTSSGLGREAVSFAVLNYGDNPVKVREFVKSYNLLREMGFVSKDVAEVLAMYDNDTDKALAHLLNTVKG
ncbi:Proline-rich cell wall protein-like [Zostera marina]|uniref:Proline-rich cell wall protein-like n=1 Tax=Zostera marina TaxID=29655 RepID=A0A0K9PGW4_ZOSMR|nr:Proline-rich cell wall protein-like [Zostera marina]